MVKLCDVRELSCFSKLSRFVRNIFITSIPKIITGAVEDLRLEKIVGVGSSVQVTEWSVLFTSLDMTQSMKSK
jgi:hypothetical protein